MPRQPPPRTKKRKRPPEEIASPASLEVIAVVRQGGRVTKKRTIEKTKFDPRVSPSLPNDIETLSSPTLQTPLEPSDKSKPSGESSTGAQSRSVSVSASYFCHVIFFIFFQTRIREWIPHRGVFLHEVLRREAPPPNNPSCATCISSPEYRCLTCVPKQLVCKGCLLSRHTRVPFHKVQVHILKFIPSC